jgi:hypothetical protein
MEGIATECRFCHRFEAEICVAGLEGINSDWRWGWMCVLREGWATVVRWGTPPPSEFSLVLSRMQLRKEWGLELQHLRLLSYCGWVKITFLIPGSSLFPYNRSQVCLLFTTMPLGSQLNFCLNFCLNHPLFPHFLPSELLDGGNETEVGSCAVMQIFLYKQNRHGVLR